jgi:GNAT superfamily N-acetyltransferase
VLTGSLAEIEHMWMQPEHMGSGIGRALFEHAKRRAEEAGANVLELSGRSKRGRFLCAHGRQNASVKFQRAWRASKIRTLPRMRMKTMTVLGALNFEL